MDVFLIFLLAGFSTGCSTRLDVGEPCFWEDNSAQWEVVSSGHNSVCMSVLQGVWDREGCCAQFLQQRDMWSLCFALQWLSWVKIFNVQVLLNQPVLLSPVSTVWFSFSFYFYFSWPMSAQDWLSSLWQMKWWKFQLFQAGSRATRLYLDHLWMYFRCIHCSHLRLDFPRGATSFGKEPHACS